MKKGLGPIFHAHAIFFGFLPYFSPNQTLPIRVWCLLHLDTFLTCRLVPLNLFLLRQRLPALSKACQNMLACKELLGLVIQFKLDLKLLHRHRFKLFLDFRPHGLHEGLVATWLPWLLLLHCLLLLGFALALGGLGLCLGRGRRRCLGRALLLLHNLGRLEVKFAKSFIEIKPVLLSQRHYAVSRVLVQHRLDSGLERLVDRNGRHRCWFACSCLGVCGHLLSNSKKVFQFFKFCKK